MSEKAKVGEEKTTPIQSGQDSKVEKGQALLVRKRITYIPDKKAGFKALNLGFFLTPRIKTPLDLFEYLVIAKVPAISQVSVDQGKDGLTVTMKKRKFSERDAKKIGRYMQLTRTIKTPDALIELLGKYGYVNDQYTLVESEEEARDAMKVFEKRVEEGHRRKGQ